MMLILPAMEMEDLTLISSCFAKFPFLLITFVSITVPSTHWGYQETSDSLEAFFSRVCTFAVVLGSVRQRLHVLGACMVQLGAGGGFRDGA